MENLKNHLEIALQHQRDSLLDKLDGLAERELRQPRTPTGTNLLGIVKHCLNVEVGYFGPTFGRDWPTPEELVAEERYDTDPQADWYATEDEAAADLIDLYRRVQTFAHETIAERPLDAPGLVPHWSPAEVTLGQIMVHVTGELARHAGHADILREQIDGRVGYWGTDDNIPDDFDWETYQRTLSSIADRFYGTVGPTAPK